MTRKDTMNTDPQALVALFIETYGEHPAASRHRFNDFCDGYLAALASKPDAAPADDFDRWQANPYTKVLQKSIAEDYVPRAASSAAPAGSAVEALRELVAIEDLKKSFAEANYHASRFPTDENYAVIDQLATELGRRKPSAWAAARAALAAAPVSPPEPFAHMLEGPFKPANEGRVIDDEGSQFDVLLRIDGNWESDQQRKDYAQAVCDRLNVAALAVQPLPLLEQSTDSSGASPSGTACSGPSAPEPKVSALRVPPAGATCPWCDGQYITTWAADDLRTGYRLRDGIKVYHCREAAIGD